MDDPGNFYKVDIATGVHTLLGVIPSPAGAETWTAMATDPTTGILYGITTNIGSSSLCIIDPVGLSAVLVGPLGTAGAIAMAIDGGGNHVCQRARFGNRFCHLADFRWQPRGKLNDSNKLSDKVGHKGFGLLTLGFVFFQHLDARAQIRPAIFP